jgi:selenoprotein W-related protein
MRSRIEITYCTQCRWLLRAAWMAQELLTTFEGRVGEVALVPGTGGVFQIRVNDQLVWCREAQSGFPEIKQLKQLVRDIIAPDMELGHSDRRPSATNT